jgi:CRISPR-associated protein Cas1
VYGKDFKRKTKYFIEKDVINAFLNYGYSLLRSKITHYLTINGLLPYFSIFHSPNNNNFALADDLIECYRFLIDCLVFKNLEKFQYAEILDTNLKKLALSVFSVKVNVKNKGNFTLNEAIDLAIKDYKQFLITKDSKYLNTFKIKLF